MQNPTYRTIGRATIQIIKTSRRYRQIVVTGSGTASVRNVHIRDLARVFEATWRDVVANAKRPGGTKNWVQGFKGKPVLGNTTSIAGRAPKISRNSPNFGRN